MIKNYSIEQKDFDLNIDNNTIKLDIQIIRDILKKVQEAITDIDKRLDAGGL